MRVFSRALFAIRPQKRTLRRPFQALSAGRRHRDGGRSRKTGLSTVCSHRSHRAAGGARCRSSDPCLGRVPYCGCHSPGRGRLNATSAARTCQPGQARFWTWFTVFPCQQPPLFQRVRRNGRVKDFPCSPDSQCFSTDGGFSQVFSGIFRKFSGISLSSVSVSSQRVLITSESHCGGRGFHLGRSLGKNTLRTQGYDGR